MRSLKDSIERMKVEMARVFGKEVKLCPLLDRKCLGKLCAWYVEEVGCSVLILALVSMQGGRAGEPAVGR